MSDFGVIRFRLHASGPDGRQVGPVELDVPISPRPVLIHITRVSVIDVGVLEWDTDGFVGSDGTPDPAFTVEGMTPIATFALGGGAIACVYDAEPADGWHWAIYAQPQVIFHDVPFVVPQFGLVG